MSDFEIGEFGNAWIFLQLYGGSGYVFFTEIEETHWVYVGWRICGILSGDRGVRRVDGQDRDVLFLPIVVVEQM